MGVLFERLASDQDVSSALCDLCDEGEVVLLLLCAGKWVDWVCLWTNDVYLATTLVS